MKKKIVNFLKTKGFSTHPEESDKMIYEFASNSGVVASCYESDDNEEKYEFTMNYLSLGSGDPELIFCSLSGQDLMDRFDIMYQLSYNLFDFLRDKKF